MNALCNLLHKKLREVAASLPGRFLSRRCFTLCIILEVEPRIAKQYKCHHCCSCKNYRVKGMEGGKKCLCVVFWLTRRSRVRGKKKLFVASYITSNKLLLVTRHILTTDLQKCLKVGSVKYSNSLSPPSFVKKVRTGSKSSRAKVKEVNNPV